MQFLKTLLIVFTVAIAVAFSINNWTTVPIRLGGGLIADVNLPLLTLVCFLAGLIPAWLTLQAVKWRLRNRLASTERAVENLRAAVAPAPAPPVAEPTPTADAPPLVVSPTP
jgi:putative membrane protein